MQPTDRIPNAIGPALQALFDVCEQVTTPGDEQINGPDPCWDREWSCHLNPASIVTVNETQLIEYIDYGQHHDPEMDWSWLPSTNADEETTCYCEYDGFDGTCTRCLQCTGIGGCCNCTQMIPHPDFH